MIPGYLGHSGASKAGHTPQPRRGCPTRDEGNGTPAVMCYFIPRRFQAEARSSEWVVSGVYVHLLIMHHTSTSMLLRGNLIHRIVGLSRGSFEEIQDGPGFDSTSPQGQDILAPLEVFVCIRELKNGSCNFQPVRYLGVCSFWLARQKGDKGLGRSRRTFSRREGSARWFFG